MVFKCSSVHVCARLTALVGLTGNLVQKPFN